MRLTNQQGNELIKKYLQEDHIFSVARIGIGGETMGCVHLDRGENIPPSIERMLRINAGFYGDDLTTFHREYLAGIKSADIQVEWDAITAYQNYLFNNHSPNSIKVSNRSIEPIYFTNPWSEELAGKKVLVIYPFEASIQEQYARRELLHSNPKVLPEFILKTYKSVQSIGGVGPHKNWTESLEVMKRDISKLDFDIALLGCGSYGLPLVNFIKTELHRTAIYVGGGLQLLFGIKGKRWDTHTDVAKMYNEHWVYPKENERPTAFKMVEGGCYW